MKEASLRGSWVSAEQTLRVGASGDQAGALLLRHTAVNGQGWDSTPNPAGSQVSHFLEPHDAHKCRRSGSVGVIPVQGEGGSRMGQGGPPTGMPSDKVWGHPKESSRAKIALERPYEWRISHLPL